MRYVTVLSVAGSDCSGGAGLQADIKTVSALRCYAASAVTAVTAQNSRGVRSVLPVPAEMVRAQLEAVADDLEIDAVKIGMLAREDVIAAVADFLETRRLPVVLDPVLVSSSGFPLLEPTAVDLLCARLLPLATLVTPNLPESELMAGMEAIGRGQMEEAGRKIVAKGCRAALVKGGHLKGTDMTDVLVDSEGGVSVFQADKVETKNTHGTGCALSSAIAAYLARGFALKQAVERAKAYVRAALSAGKDVNAGKGHGPMDHFFNPHKLIIK